MSMTSLNGWNFFLAKGEKKVGLVVVHEIFGLNEYTEGVASDLAKAGYSAAAIDLFRGAKAKSLDEGMRLREAVTRDALDEGMSAGADLLKRQAGAEVVGSLGFCMGGGFALQAACDLGLDFCVDYYGQIQDAEDAARLKGPTLLVLGSDDPRVTPWAFERFLPSATRHKKRVEVELYPNAKHAFHRPGGEAYNPQAAADAWEKTLRFLSQFRERP